jgi:sulfur-oxidizing protein SoxY
MGPGPAPDGLFERQAGPCPSAPERWSRRRFIDVCGLGVSTVVGHALPAWGQTRDGVHRPELVLPQLAENPTAVAVRIAVSHPMQPDHFIKSIAVVVDRDPIPSKGTYHFSPANGEPWVAFPMRSGVGGVVRAIVECSRHGQFSGSRPLRVTSDGCATFSEGAWRGQPGNVRLKIAPPRRVGDVVEVRTKIDYDSDTGLTLKAGAYVRERREAFLRQLRVYFDRELISEYMLTSAISSNPIIRFPVRVNRAGTLRVVFADYDGGSWEAAERVPLPDES